MKVLLWTRNNYLKIELLTRLNNCGEKGVFVLATPNRPDLVASATGSDEKD